MFIGFYILMSGNCWGIYLNRYNLWNCRNLKNERILNNNYKYMKKKEFFFCNFYDVIGVY